MTSKTNRYSQRTARRYRRKGRARAVREVLCVVVAVAFVYIIAEWLFGSYSPAAAHAQKPATPEWELSGSLEDVVIPDEIPQHIVRYPGFTVNFNPHRHVPNYVVWELTAHKINGNAQRVKNFFHDPDVPGCPTPNDYRKSGYTRGHMAPAADMKWSAEAMRASNNLTNVCPQAASMNSGVWSKLEENCRNWAKRDSAIVIICGPVLSDRMPLHIGKNNVAVPERFFKVVLAPYANPPRGIGFVVANGKVTGGVQSQALSIDEVEAITGYDFFSALPDDIETEVEKQNSYPRWQTLK